ncbi:MAG: hypothetical protein LBQ40_02400 [Clostridiales bacterium]|jgi:hypothetical protein|nr:hypothetical protein [Clostridiales bacterium]
MKRKLLLAVCLICAAAALSACADADVEYAVYNYSDGAIAYSISVEIKEETISNPIYDAQTITIILSEVFKAYGYDTVTEGSKVVAGMYFESRAAYDAYYGIDEEEEVSDDTEFYKVGGLFYDKYVTRRASVFKDVEQTVERACRENPYLKDAAITDDLGEIISYVKDDVALLDYEAFGYVYRYETYLKSIDSNADKKEFDESTGLYAHVFEMDYSAKGEIIELNRTVPNQITWTAAAMIIAASVVAAVLVVGKKKKKA